MNTHGDASKSDFTLDDLIRASKDSIRMSDTLRSIRSLEDYIVDAKKSIAARDALLKSRSSWTLEDYTSDARAQIMMRDDREIESDDLPTVVESKVAVVAATKMIRRVVKSKQTSWFQGLLSSSVVSATKNSLVFVGGTLTSMYVGSVVEGITGSPLVGRLAGQFTVHVISSIPEMVTHPGGVRALGRRLVAIATQSVTQAAGSSLFGSETVVNQFAGTIVGTLVAGKFNGYMSGMGIVASESDGLAAQHLFDEFEAEEEEEAEEEAEDEDSLSFLQRNRRRLAVGVSLAAAAAAISVNIMVGGSVPASTWRLVKGSGAARLAAAGAVQNVLRVPIGVISRFVQRQTLRVLESVGVSDASVVPLAVRRRIKLRILEETVYQITVADLVRTTISTTEFAALNVASNRAVDRASKWGSVAEASSDLAGAYNAAADGVRNVASAVRGAMDGARRFMADDQDMAEVDFLESLRVEDDMDDPFSVAPERSTVVEARQEARRAQVEKDAAFLKALRTAPKKSTMAEFRSHKSDEQGDKDFKFSNLLHESASLDRRNARLAKRLESRLQSVEVDQSAIEGESAHWMTREMVDAVGAFEQTSAGKLAKGYQGVNVRGVAYQAGQLYVESVSGAKVLGTAYKTYKSVQEGSRVVRAAARAAAIVGAGTAHQEVLDSLDDAVSDAVLPELVDMREAVKSLDKGIVNSLDKATSFEAYESVMAASGYHPYKSRAHGIADITLGKEAVSRIATFALGVLSMFG